MAQESVAQMNTLKSSRLEKSGLAVDKVDQGVVVKCSVQHKRVDLIMMQACGAAMSIVLYFGDWRSVDRQSQEGSAGFSLPVSPSCRHSRG